MTELPAPGASPIYVELVFAEPGAIWQKALKVPAGTTARQALDQSGFARACPDSAALISAMGIFGQRCREDYVLQEGDRLELYRPLRFDPKESRRRRAMHKKRAKNGSSTV